MANPDPLDPELERWIRSFRGPLIGYLASRGAGWQEAEELAMDTFAEAWLARDRLRARAGDMPAIGGWLRGIAHNLLFAGLRRRQQHTAEPLTADGPPAPSPMVDDRHDALRTAFRQLRPEHQEVLRMHYLEASTAADVAAVLGITQKAVEGRLYQARRALRALADRTLRTAGASP